MKFTVQFTADRVTEESAAEGMAAESGWIDPELSMRRIFDDADEVAAFRFDTYEEAESFIEETIGECEDASAPSYYAKDERIYDGESWRYAGHIEEVEE